MMKRKRRKKEGFHCYKYLKYIKNETRRANNQPEAMKTQDKDNSVHQIDPQLTGMDVEVGSTNEKDPERE